MLGCSTDHDSVVGVVLSVHASVVVGVGVGVFACLQRLIIICNLIG